MFWTSERRWLLWCATKRKDEMRGNLHRLYRQAVSLWGVATSRCKLAVKQLPLKGAVRRDASRQEAVLGSEIAR